MLEAHADASCMQLFADYSCWEGNIMVRAHFKSKPEIFAHHFHIEKCLFRFVKYKRTSILFESVAQMRIEFKCSKIIYILKKKIVPYLNHGGANGAITKNVNGDIFLDSGALCEENTFAESNHLGRKVQIDSDLHAQCFAYATNMSCTRRNEHKHGMN